MNFEDVKVGQKVRYRGSIKCVIGPVGTCMYKAPDGWIAVEFDISHLDLHTCDGHCKEDHGWWCKPIFLDPVEEEVVDNSTPCAPLPVEETANDRGVSNNQVDVHIARLEDVVETLFTMGVSRQDMLELFNDISKKHFSEKQLRDRIAKIKDKVRKCQN
jgi:hypothetical protein